MSDYQAKLLNDMADTRRATHASTWVGKIHKVQSKNGEQKVRVEIGTQADGTPMYSPWLFTRDHRGSSREEKKYHKGMNVVLDSPSGDFRQATVSHWSENEKHLQPDHADKNHETYQFNTTRTRTGADFHEKWLAKDSSSSGGGAGGSGGLSAEFGASQGSPGTGDSGGGQGQYTDPQKHSVAVSRMGGYPGAPSKDTEPWDGPNPTGQGSPKKQHLKWAGTAGNTPDVNGDVIANQFDKRAKHEITDGSIKTMVVGNSDQMKESPESGDGNYQSATKTDQQDDFLQHQTKDAQGNKTTTTWTKKQITHQMQDGQGNYSQIIQQAGQILAMVKGQGGTTTFQITPSQISINDANTISQMSSTPPNDPQPGDPPAVLHETYNLLAVDLSAGAPVLGNPVYTRVS